MSDVVSDVEFGFDVFQVLEAFGWRFLLKVFQTYQLSNCISAWGASHLFDPIWSKLRKPVLSWTKPSTVRYHPARDLPSAQLNSGGLTVQHAWRTSPFLWPESGIRWDKSCASFLSCNHGDD